MGQVGLWRKSVHSGIRTHEHTAVASTILQTTQVASQVTDLGAVYGTGPAIAPTHDAAYWANATAGLDFSEADRVPTGKFNRLLWKGLKGNAQYPTRRASHQSND